MWYLEALGGVNTTVKIRDDDVVVLIDAYDVLLFPAVRRIAEVLISAICISAAGFLTCIEMCRA